MKVRMRETELGGAEKSNTLDIHLRHKYKPFKH